MSMMLGMAKEKVTITLDRSRVDEVVRLTGAVSTSAAIDLALRHLIKAERLASDLRAYALHPPTAFEKAVGELPQNWSDIADDTDWDAVCRTPPAELKSGKSGKAK
jgi:Arc/MetJ family transcription regulator